MMYRFWYLVFVMLFIYPQINNSALVSNYYLNQEEIENEYCINKNDVELKCQGKCHLEEQINETSNSDDDSSKPELYECEMTYFLQTTEVKINPVSNINQPLRNKYYALLSGILQQLDKPPKHRVSFNPQLV